MSERLERYVRRIWEVGQEINLTGAAYGRVHWHNETDIETHPYGYYHTLAGTAAVSGSKTALEIGTHWGGSAVSIIRGLQRNDPDARLTTVDVTTESDNYLPAMNERGITKVVGNANTLEVIEAIQADLPSADLLYIDADHFALSTLLNLSIYQTLLRPKLALFDDIAFNDSMREFWRMVRKAYPDQSIDCAEVEPATRNPWPPSGFGLIVFDATLLDNDRNQSGKSSSAPI